MDYVGGFGGPCLTRPAAAACCSKRRSKGRGRRRGTFSANPNLEGKVQSSRPRTPERQPRYAVSIHILFAKLHDDGPCAVCGSTEGGFLIPSLVPYDNGLWFVGRSFVGNYSLISFPRLLQRKTMGHDLTSTIARRFLGTARSLDLGQMLPEAKLAKGSG